jgi:gas vesicle protein
MNEWVLFTIGIFIGGIIGVMTIAVVSAGKSADLYREIQDLRTQRKLLKEELLKKQPSKLRPRKYRKKNV